MKQSGGVWEFGVQGKVKARLSCIVGVLSCPYEMVVWSTITITARIAESVRIEKYTLFGFASPALGLALCV